MRKVFVRLVIVLIILYNTKISYYVLLRVLSPREYNLKLITSRSISR